MEHIDIRITSVEGQAIDGSFFFSIKKTEDMKMAEKELRTENDAAYQIIADFAYDVFRIFNDKYKATPIKVQKLLFIAEMYSIHNYNQSLFLDDVEFECNNCGFKIPTLTDYIKNVISDGEIVDEKIIPTEEEMLKISSLKKDYVSKGIDSQILELIADTIISFGKYCPVSLGEILNDFKSNSESSVFKQQPPFIFKKNEFYLLLRNLTNLKGKNAIADFILNYDR